MQVSSDSFFESHIRDLIFKSKKTGQPVFSEFLNDKEKIIADRISNELSCDHIFYGGYSDADNVILSVYTDKQPLLSDFPIKCLKVNITNKNATLKHSDYMGAIMSLGIDRDVFGDIISYPDKAYIYVSEIMTEYFLDNFTEVGREKCFITVEDDSFVPDLKEKFSEQQIIIASDRLDCFISALCRMSREKSLETVRKRLVFVNGSEVNNPSKKLFEGDKIVIRGYGKFIIGQCDGKTQKDRLKIKIKKYN